jgi:hypothetical protein
MSRGVIFFVSSMVMVVVSYSATFTVTNTSDSGSGSLRMAITSANITPGSPHTIVFNIPLTDPGYSNTRGVWKIGLTTALPYITGSNITIDGTTQTTFAGNTNPFGPEIELDGNNTLDYGLFVFNGSNIIIKGFIIRRFINGVQIAGATSQHHAIRGNYIGVNHDATDTSGCYVGIEILSSAGNVMIGGVNPEDRNIVSGNHHIGIRLLSSSNNTLYNNYIGLDRTGNIALPNFDGLSLEAVTQNNVIGGSSPGMRNVISGNYAYGLPLIGLHTRNNLIIGNYIGTNANGTAAVPNTYGILFDDGARYNTIGGYAPGERNVLSGNTGYGLFIYNLGTTENYVYGNLIGTDYSGTSAIPNGNGIVIDGAATKHYIDGNVISGNSQQGIVIHITGSDQHVITRNLIGTDISETLMLGNGSDGIRIAEGGRYNIIGIAPDSGNVIAFNGGNGITLMTSADVCNRISGNSIYNNALLGINLWPAGVTPNDPGDVDSGPNSGMNFPVISSASFNGATAETTISGNLDTQNPQHCIIEIFLSDGDQSGHGQGKLYLGAAVPNSDGTFTFSFQHPQIINLACATAQDNCGNTSEFSANYILPPPNDIEESNTEPSIHVFPNPACETLNIYCKENANIVIVNSSGQSMFVTNLNRGVNTINVSSWPSGQYVVSTPESVIPVLIIKKTGTN